MKGAGLLLVFVLGTTTACASGIGDAHGMPSHQNYVTFTKSVPGEGNFVMYAFIPPKQVHTLGYTPGAEGQTVVEDKTSTLRDEDSAAFERLFTLERCTTYHADEWKGPGGEAAPQKCPDTQRVCSPTPPGGQGQPVCMCVPPPGSLSVRQYEVAFEGVGEAQHGLFTFRDPMTAVTSEMVTALEEIRRHHFGK